MISQESLDHLERFDPWAQRLSEINLNWIEALIGAPIEMLGARGGVEVFATINWAGTTIVFSSSAFRLLREQERRDLQFDTLRRDSAGAQLAISQHLPNRAAVLRL